MNDTIKIVIENLEPDTQYTLRGMLHRANVSEDTPMSEIFQVMQPNGYTSAELNAYVTAVAMGQKLAHGKFAPKLTFAQRCEVLALHRMGCTREVLAKMFHLDRRTVTHIQNPASPRYNNVREEEKRMGRENFIKKYVTEESQRKMLAIMAETKEGNNRNAKGKQGIHTVQGPMCTFPHRVMIQWREVPEAGWYYQDLDSDFPKDWFTTGPESMKTSQACYDGMVQDITDKVS